MTVLTLFRGDFWPQDCYQEVAEMKRGRLEKCSACKAVQYCDEDCQASLPLLSASITITSPLSKRRSGPIPDLTFLHQSLGIEGLSLLLQYLKQS